MRAHKYASASVCDFNGVSSSLPPPSAAPQNVCGEYQNKFQLTYCLYCLQCSTCCCTETTPLSDSSYAHSEERTKNVIEPMTQKGEWNQGMTARVLI